MRSLPDDSPFFGVAGCDSSLNFAVIDFSDPAGPSGGFPVEKSACQLGAGGWGSLPPAGEAASSVHMELSLCSRLFCSKMRR